MSDKIKLVAIGHDEDDVRTAAVEAALELIRAKALGGATNLNAEFDLLGKFADQIEAALGKQK